MALRKVLYTFYCTYRSPTPLEKHSKTGEVLLESNASSLSGTIALFIIFLIIYFFGLMFFSVGQSSLQSIVKMKEDLLMELDELGPLLPSNSLDELIEGLGGPKKVSEVSFSFMIILVVSV